MGVYENGARILAATSISFGADPSTTGTVRLSAGGSIKVRAPNDSEDVDLFVFDGNGNLAFGDASWEPFLYPITDNQLDLGLSDKRWRVLYAVEGQFGTPSTDAIQFRTGGFAYIQNMPTSDPLLAGQLYSMNAAGVAAELAAGSRYVLISNGE